MNEKALNEMVEKNIDSAENEIGYELTEEDLAYSRKIIAQLSGYYARKDSDLAKKRKEKAKRRTANRTARNSRRINRK